MELHNVLIVQMRSTFQVLSGLDEEGVTTDDFRVIGLNPSEPKSFSVATKSNEDGTTDTVEVWRRRAC